MENKITICYVDDDATLVLDKYLSDYCNKRNANYRFIGVEVGETFSDVINKLIMERGNIMILDSKLYKDDDAGDKITGEELEMVLGNRCRYLTTILISQNDKNNKLNCIKKYSARKDKNKYSSELDYYDKILGKILDSEYNKFNRFFNLVLGSLDEKKIVDKCEIENIKAELDNETPELPLTKEDIDKTVDLLNKLFETLE